MQGIAVKVTVTFEAPDVGTLASFFQPLIAKEKIMTTLQDIQNEVQETKAAVESLVGVINTQSTKLTELSQQLDAAIAANDPVALAAIKEGLDALQKQAADVVAANSAAAA